PVLDNDGYAVCPNCETRVHCGIVVDHSNLPPKAIIECREKGCETHWVIAFSPENGFATLAMHLDEQEEESRQGDDVIFPYLELCLIT
ncbi:hypothetical protein L208DRAFT_1235902, partial [Tricholoma matsutake]